MTRPILYLGNIAITVELITPEVASHMLSTANVNNRRLRARYVMQYADDMTAGKWEKKPVAICFNTLKQLCNGQHTLHAIVESGMAQEMLVARNMTDRQIAMMDRGIARTLTDISHFLGQEFDSRRASIARVVGFGPEDSAPRSFDALFDAYVAHKDEIDMVIEASPTKSKNMSACVMAVCVKALRLHPQKRVERFLHVLRTGLADGAHESAVIRLREYLNSLHGANTTKVRVETYCKTMSALDYFLRGQAISKLYGTSEDLFKV
jgi:hypothetical protein